MQKRLTWPGLPYPLVRARNEHNRRELQSPDNLSTYGDTEDEHIGLDRAGFDRRLINKTGEGLVLDILLGIVGAFVGGFVFTHFFGAAGVTGFNLYSMFVAVIGAVIVLLIYHLVFRRRAI